MVWKHEMDHEIYPWYLQTLTRKTKPLGCNKMTKSMKGMAEMQVFLEAE